MFEVRYRISQNKLLHSPGPSRGLDEFLAFRQAAVLAAGQHGDGLRNVSRISEETVRRVHASHGEEGVFSLLFLAMSQNAGDFDHFAEFVVPWWNALHTDDEPLSPDNHRLPACADLARFAGNVLQPSLSRKLYQPGRKDGYIVYGLGGPRILISHPFSGSSSFHYDLYGNSADIVSSLALAGYGGSFLFLDLLPGLNDEVHGLPTWLLWFSKIAVHSGLVIFVTEGSQELRDSQVLESRYTPDRVLKKVVTFPAGEFRWAETVPELPIWKILREDGQPMEWDEYLAYESNHSRPFVTSYLLQGFPSDRLICIEEDGTIRTSPSTTPSMRSDRTLTC